MGEEKPIVAYVILVVTVGKEYEVLEMLRKMPQVTDARVVYGEYDLVAKIEVSSMKELEDTIMSIRGIEGVIRSVTLISA